MGEIQDEIHAKYGNLYDQYYTEGVAEYVKTLFPAGFTGVVVDVGAYHAKWLSNSYLLEQEGWDAYCIEPNPHCAELLEGRKNVFNFAAGAVNEDNVDFYIYKIGQGPSGEAGGSGLLTIDNVPEYICTTVKVNVRTLDWFLETQGIDHVDFLALDTEGTELDILRGIDLDRWRVKVVAIEILGEKGQDQYLTSRGFTRYPENFFWNYVYYRGVK